MRSFALTGAALCLAMGVALAPAGATVITVGNRSGSNNIAPFGGYNTISPSRYQQVYAASDFGSAAILIDAIAFEAQAIGKQGGPAPDPGEVAGGNFVITLSTTSKLVDGLDTSNYDANIGSHVVTIFSGALSSAYVKPFLTFDVADYLFDPSAGNLLLDVKITGMTQGTARFYADSGLANGVYSRATDTAQAGAAGYGLNTTFTYRLPATQSAAPEAATWLMMIGGFGMIGTALRRRARVAFA